MAQAFISEAAHGAAGTRLPLSCCCTPIPNIGVTSASARLCPGAGAKGPTAAFTCLSYIRWHDWRFNITWVLYMNVHVCACVHTHIYMWSGWCFVFLSGTDGRRSNSELLETIQMFKWEVSWRKNVSENAFVPEWIKYTHYWCVPMHQLA